MNKTNPFQFADLYKEIASTKTLTLKNYVRKKCRFCGLDDTVVTFRTEAHICPELLGENRFLSPDECDDCNRKFSSYESHLSKCFLPYLVMVGVKGKKKVPDFHSRTDGGIEQTRTKAIFAEDGLLNFEIGQLGDYEVDEVAKTGFFRFRLAPHRPLSVYRALVKIGLSLLPVEYLDEYKGALYWIREQENVINFPRAIVTLLYANKFELPAAYLYETTEIFHEGGFRPPLMLVVNFGNLIVQVPMPMPSRYNPLELKGMKALIELYPAFVFNDDKRESETISGRKITIRWQFTQMDLSGQDSVGRDEVINFKFDRLE